VSRPTTFSNGRVEWRDEKGQLHRDDGPAASYPDGRKIWFRDGVKIREQR
jgi:hypothetical protein